MKRSFKSNLHVSNGSYKTNCAISFFEQTQISLPQKEMDSLVLMSGYIIPEGVVDELVSSLRAVGSKEDFFTLRTVSKVFKKQIERHMIQICRFKNRQGDNLIRQKLQELYEQNFEGGVAIYGTAARFFKINPVVLPPLRVLEVLTDHFSVKYWDFLPTTTEALTWPSLSNRNLKEIFKRTAHSLTKLTSPSSEIRNSGFQYLSANLLELSIDNLDVKLPLRKLTKLTAGIINDLQLVPTTVKHLRLVRGDITPPRNWSGMTHLEKLEFQKRKDRSDIELLFTHLPNSLTALELLSNELVLKSNGSFPPNIKHLGVEQAGYLPEGLQSFAYSKSFCNPKCPSTLTSFSYRRNYRIAKGICGGIVGKNVRELYLEHTIQHEAVEGDDDHALWNIPGQVTKLSLTRFDVPISVLQGLPATVKHLELRLCKSELCEEAKKSLRKDLQVTIREPLIYCEQS
eukprot:TRINITY_DN3640_c0_g1_i1.p1 TRINITY_DN3640_c0_g1~~TRINITY_DN3640_c0_g1_i1.p1  ORF type:complete len:457 (+),score=85.94 TRINITY_DN3640_c0_g1_i1:375-1745(+)